MDVKYVVKLCLEAGLKEEGVYLLSLLDQQQQALELALTINLGNQPLILWQGYIFWPETLPCFLGLTVFFKFFRLF